MTILNTSDDVAASKKKGALAYAAMWKAKFGFPVPQDLIDRWWPMSEMRDEVSHDSRRV